MRNKIFNVSESIYDLFEKSQSAYMADFQLHDSQVHREEKLNLQKKKLKEFIEKQQH